MRVELKFYAHGPPLEPELMGPYLSKVIHYLYCPVSETSLTEMYTLELTFVSLCV